MKKSINIIAEALAQIQSGKKVNINEVKDNYLKARKEEG
jgi:hypothetical protein